MSLFFENSEVRFRHKNVFCSEIEESRTGFKLAKLVLIVQKATTKKLGYCGSRFYAL